MSRISTRTRILVVVGILVFLLGLGGSFAYANHQSQATPPAHGDAYIEMDSPTGASGATGATGAGGGTGPTGVSG
jgi:hypothetical protein